LEKCASLILIAGQANTAAAVGKLFAASARDLLVLGKRVRRIIIVDQETPAVILVKILWANVLNLVLENRVKRVFTVRQANIVVVLIIKNVVVVLVLETRVIQITIVPLANVVMKIRNVSQEFATLISLHKVVVSGLLSSPQFLVSYFFWS
jgi:hypothetical protein